ncbi:hypothetical protein [Chitinophaga sp. Cy-1792]|uniref:hypothetical protein n=1 Tax=Chitinophaga sp. Cy-1792 TaxID=2608339 RepID=UPI001420BD36|nr:hypothetical protein [Chitinophaga sp. Cy-1792]NIG55377.1 hypothetical protein [Chitinophaga sp. Cy-1792]
MNNIEFVNAIKIAVEGASISGMLELLRENKVPNDTVRRLSAFYNSLDDKGQKLIEEIIKESVQSAVFGFFCALDGVRSVENGPDKGTLELRYKNEVKQEDILLNDFDDEFLHDLYNT